jgi:hypothetical protein
MRLLILTSFFLSFLISCSSGNDKSKSLMTDTIKKVPPAPGIQMTKEFKDIDTAISLTLYNLTPFDKTVNRNQKIKNVKTAIISAMPDEAFRYLELDCLKINTETKKTYKDTTEKAPDCRLNEFHQIDLDGDGDLDIVYSSSFDQYIQGDTNYLLLLQNNEGSYKRFTINGYLYDANFPQLPNRIITFKTVSRPCCDYFNYNFFETTFNTKSWTFDTKHVLEIHQSKVNEE